MYLYIIDNNEPYPEDHSVVELYCTELLSKEEFSKVVQMAFDLCGGKDVYYEKVAKKIVEIDARFFFPPKAIAVAYIGMEEDDYNNEIRGVY